MHRWPLANWALILFTCLVSVSLFPSLRRWEHRATFGITISHGEFVATYGGDKPGHIIDDLILEPGYFRPSQLVGAMFVHAGWMHLLGNMFFLWLFGNAVNARLSHLGFLGIYFGTGIFANIVSLLLGPPIASLGASGAIMGIMGAFLILYPLNEARCVYVFIIKVGEKYLACYWVVLFFLIIDLLGLLNGGGSIDHLAHISGLFAGAAVVAALIYYGYISGHYNEQNLLQVLNIKPRDICPQPDPESEP